MARYPHPEKTLDNIITTASSLFLEKGYEQTSIQDILDALHLSKGGLYHHFASKEEILIAVIKRHGELTYRYLHEMIQSIEAENAKEKLKKVLYYLATDTQMHRYDQTMKSQLGNAHFVVSGIQNCIRVDAPILANLIQEGIKDGSIQSDDPDLAAEVFLLLSNYWVNPALYDLPKDQVKRRLSYLKKLLEKMGLDILDDRLMDILISSYENLEKKEG